MDYGEKRCGFAVSDPSGIIAMPLEVVEVSSQEDVIQAAKRMVDEREASRFVIGLPLNMDGSAGPMAEKIQALIPILEETLGVPVHSWDERLSTSMVDRTLIEADVSRKKRKTVRDKLAAQVILQGYLDSSSDYAIQDDY